VINKYTIDLRQFNSGEVDKISFPTFDQCLMYGIHKLKKAWENGTCIIQVVIISDSFCRQIVITPSPDELAVLPSFVSDIQTGIRLELKRDEIDGESRFLF